MLLLFMHCIYCNNKKLYNLKTGQLKCSNCKKKFSYKKIQKDLQTIEYFCKDYTANQTSKELGINYITVKNKYHHFRRLINIYLEEQYKNKKVIEYDEYIYIQKNKRKIKENIFDAENFLTFHYDNKVFNLLMPSLKKYKSQFLINGAEDAYFKEFSKFMIYNKISKIQKRNNLITKFWIYFENSILKYRGVSIENFHYYLKEIEFKFNYDKEAQREILIHLNFSTLDTNQSLFFRI